MFTTRPELSGTFGMVSSTHWLASQSGMAVLERGGNAFDAAVAAGFVLQVVEPHLNGPAGDVPIIGWDARAGTAAVVCGQGSVPAAATLEQFAALGLDLVPGTGLLPACVPGQFGAWLTLLRDHGTMRLGEVLDYAIGYALDGFPVVARIEATIAQVADHFTQHWPTSAQLWLPDGRPPATGTLLRNVDLATTYRGLVDAGERAGTDRVAQIDAALDSFYRGSIAERIAEFAADQELMDDSGRPHRGLLRYEDLAGWQAGIEQPVSYTYHGVEVLKPASWCQGPVFLQQLALLDELGFASLPTDGPEAIHLIAECAKLAFADREAWYGDPEFVDVPIAHLLSTDYTRDRAGLVTDSAHLGPLRPGSPGGRTPYLPAGSTTAQDRGGQLGAALGEPTVRPTGTTAGDTCHVDVVDRWGNVVAATPSGGWLQSSPAIPGLGFCLGTRAQMFWLDPGAASGLGPGRRPRSTLSPTMALRDGRPYLAFGTPGGDQQDQWSLLVFLRVVDAGMGLQQAMDAPQWHITDFPASFFPRAREVGGLHIEASIGSRTLEALKRRGHVVTVEPDWSQGRHAAVQLRDGMLWGAANPRGMQNYAVGR